VTKGANNTMKTTARILSILVGTAALAWAWSSAPASLKRGPYLQSTTDTSTIVVCQTTAAAEMTLSYGTKDGVWEFEKKLPSGTTHVFQLTGLRPETDYHYQLSSGGSLVSGGADHVFRTAPPDNSRAPLRFTAWGDMGTNSSSQIDVANQMELVKPAPEFALGLGDLVYDSGAEADYDPKFFKPNAELFRRVAIWPTIGNHDAKTSSAAPYIANFYLPTDSGAPGKPSGTERYYSFDHGMAHFVCLDSETSSSSAGSPMVEWLKADLDNAKARGKRWLIAFLHHPPYTEGTHSSSEGDITAVRQNLLPILESKGVDMLLAGHSHVYERSYLVKNGAIIQNDAGTYSKIGSPDGTIYLVSGCGGKTGSGTLDEPHMAESKGNVAGFNVIDLTYEEMRATFVERDGQTTDVFRVRKATDTIPPRVALVEPLAANELAVVFDEFVKAGTGTDGAENTANYLIQPAVAVTAAKLQSDQRTVLLSTGNLAANKRYELTALRTKDTAGNAVQQDIGFVLAGTVSTPGSSAVAKGAAWKYLKGSTAPAAGWNGLSFNDGSWASGPAGFGYEDGDDATVLSDMRNLYPSVYIRTSFQVTDPAAITGMKLNVSFDDGFVAFLNGSEVARANVPVGQTNTTLASAGHEAAGFDPFDLGSVRSLLRSGTNVLAVEGHNSGIDSNDFSLHPELVLVRQGSGGGGGAPVAVIDAPVVTANRPATIPFSGSGSEAAEGALASLTWDFGDGTPLVTGENVQHLFDRDGIFTVTLTAKDMNGLEAVDEVEVRIISQGTGPKATLTASTLTVDAGDTINFSSAGSNDPDGGPIFVSWNFDDPASGTKNVASSASAQHSFSAGGVYKVTLVVVDDEGSTESETASITVGASAAPTADFRSQVSGSNPLRVSFTDQSTGTVTAWAWDFGDLSTSTQQNPQHDYAVGGTYTVHLTVTGPDGSDSSQSDITVGTSEPPVSSFATSVSSSNPLQVTFTDHSTGTVTAWSWDFGDLVTSNLQDPVHEYAAAGDYTVHLTVTGPDGTDSSDQVVHVEADTGGGPVDDGGACAAQIGSNGRPGRDASLPLAMAVALAIAALRARNARRAMATTR